MNEAARWVVICNPDSGNWFAAEWTPGAGVSDSVPCRDQAHAARVCRERNRWARALAASR